MKNQFSQGALELLRFIGAKPFDSSRAEEFLSSIPYINEILREECGCPAACVDNEYLGADTLAFLLENCADYNALAEGCDFFSEIDFDVIFGAYNQENRRRYDALVHCWFVLLGYGFKPKNGSSSLDVFGGFDIRELKNHRDYTFALTHTPNRGESWSLHIIEKSSFWEVARL